MCEERFRDAPLDHFSFATFGETFRQRYFLCTHFSKRLYNDDNDNDDEQSRDRDDGDSDAADHAAAVDPPIFFYTGNEANVELYLNATGIMWESAQQFKAILVFAEHRYYGRERRRRVHSRTPHFYSNHPQ